MELKVYHLGALQTNCYVLINELTREAVAIDVGANPALLQLEQLKHNFKVKHVLLTHGHFDHIGGAYALQKAGAKVYIGKDESEFINDGNLNLGSVFGDPVTPFEIEEYLTDGQKITLSGIEFLVIKTPGHTRGGVTYKVGDMLFCGDVLFKGSFGRIDFPTGDYLALKNSAKKLFEISGATLYSGHGELTTTNEEKLTNPINFYD